MTIVTNTLVLNALFLSASLAAGLLLALMLNEIRGQFYRRFLQSTIFFPYFVSPIVISLMLQAILSGVGGRGGMINDMLNVFDLPQLAWYTTPGAWPWILTFVKIWQLGGYTSVIFLAAITSISEEVYEAAAIDGASRTRMALSITTPLLMPTMGILIVLGVGQSSSATSRPSTPSCRTTAFSSPPPTSSTPTCSGPCGRSAISEPPRP